MQVIYCFWIFIYYQRKSIDQSYDISKLGSARKQPDEPEDQPGLWDEDDATLYSTIFLDDANLGVAQDNFVVDNTSSDCKSQSEYSRLKRNYGNRINSEENGSENPYDKLVLHTQTVNRLSVSLNHLTITHHNVRLCQPYTSSVSSRKFSDIKFTNRPQHISFFSCLFCLCSLFCIFVFFPSYWIVFGCFFQPWSI